MQRCPSCGRENPGDANFCAGCATPLAGAPLRQERKVVSVLFCDLVGFTSRAERMDPEDVRALLEPYHARVRAELERFGGAVEKFIGDAVVAVFGAPVAHEDDPERAVRAALAIRDWAREEELELRVGVNTGEALVTIGGEPLAAGDVVNTAARLQSAAPTGGILVGQTTYRATRDRIDYREEEPVAAKGKTDPVPVWEALQARSRVAVERSHAAVLVGRERELSLLRDALARSREERSAQLVTLVGVPGIGKSRLVYELFRHVDEQPELVSWRQGRCLPYGEGITFWALGEIVKAQAGILESDSKDEVERKLRDTAGDPWVESHLRPLVGLAAEASGSSDRKVESFAAWRRFLEALAEERPLVLVLEDLHWADDDLLDFVDHLVDRAAGVALLVVSTARPELLERRPAWGGGKPNAITLSISPLSDDETARLIGELLERPVLAAEVQSDLLARAGGNPLYAEQYARMLGERRDAGSVPETVQGIVASRLDLLDPGEKALLQDATVLGRVFWAGALATMADGGRFEIEERLHPLERKGFVRRERRSAVADDTQYAFLHLLVRDVAYGQIPRVNRAAKHLGAADWIESLGRPEDHAELLAHHYVEVLELAGAAGTDVADVAPRAARALGEVADRALALNAYASAAAHYRRALELTTDDDPGRPSLLLRSSRALHELMTGDEVVKQAVEALLTVGDVEGAAEAELILADLAWLRGERATSRQHLDRSVALVADLAASATKARVLTEVSRYHMLALEDERAVATGREAIAMADALGLEYVLARALNNVGVSEARLGEPDGYRKLARSIELAERLNSPELIRGYNNLGVIHASLGDIRRAAETWRRGLLASGRFGDTAMSRWLRIQVEITAAYAAGEWDAVLRRAEAVTSDSAHYLQATVLAFTAQIRLARGDLAGARSDAERSLARGREAGDPQALFPPLGFSASLALAAGERERAEELADELLGSEAIALPVASMRAPWFDLSWVLVELSRPGDLLAATSRVRRRTRWIEAAEATARGDYVGAARIYAEAGNLPAEAYTRLRAAQAGLPDAGLDQAIAFYREAGATAYLAEAEALAAATTRAAREG